MTGLAVSLGLIMDGLCATVARHAGRQHALAPLVLILWPRLKRIVLRFEALAARLRDQRSAPPIRTARQPAASPPDASPPDTSPPDTSPPDTLPRPAPTPPPHHLPCGFAWGIHSFPGHELPVYGAQLQHWLADPALPDMLAADPVLRRMLRSVCHMLAIRPDPAVLPPRSAARAAQPRPARPRKPRAPRAESNVSPTWDKLGRSRDEYRQAFQRWRRSGRTD